MQGRPCVIGINASGCTEKRRKKEYFLRCNFGVFFDIKSITDIYSDEFKV